MKNNIKILILCKDINAKKVKVKKIFEDENDSLMFLIKRNRERKK